ncbi:acetyl-CoA carboxylase biotin carboxyl carrier protein [Helicobacter sp. MIT 99-5507]|uniref:acetyl-CoA carboxylase biotin carboxyl carrier protein n=1 Tax=Helicobacter sp. MIT 99-5507 TaxID=152489 RepID=UPI000E1EBAA0|nr:acetyl-CoA carboxylase biotin carboxyl carrier protein [Helicobacter sp. MIT 99-5507]RDU57266.1 acetyl-CoA carboxylase biotin carboxyl carrier protein [Helicobacter sp. MIT 99-5507]
MNMQEIRKLLEMFDNSSSVKLKIINENFEISLEKSGAKLPKLQNVNPVSQVPVSNTQVESADTLSIPQATQVPNKTSVNTEVITSPMVGTFYRAPSPDSAPYVNVGDKVKKGQTIAIIEAMKIMNEIEAEFDCKIIDIIPSDAQSVEFSSELFVIEKI